LLQLGVILVGIPILTLTAAARLGDAGSLMDISSNDFIPEGMASRAVFLILPFFLSISVSYDAYMRFQSAKSETVAKWGSILAGLLVIGTSLCVGLVGDAGRLLYPELESGAVFPHVIQETLSPLFAGLVISALLAAAMSSANCLLLSLAGCFTRDLYNKVLYPSRDIDELKHSRLVSRIVIVGAVTVGIAIALHAKGILYTMILFNYPYMGSMLVPLLGGVLWKGATFQGAVAAIIVGGTVGVVSFAAGVPGPFNGLLNVDLGLLVAWVVSAVVFIAFSLASSRS
jgi:SSS family solute:Na+ symporter